MLRTRFNTVKKLRLVLLVVIVLFALVTIVGKGGGGDGGGGGGDTTAPTVRIKFPGLVVLTSGDSILVTGTADDANMITRVRVAGMDATTTDNFANWRATVPLMPGNHMLTVETTDEFSNIDSAAATIDVDARGPIWESGRVALDSDNGRALVINENPYSIVSVDLATGVRTTLSDNAAGVNGGDANPFATPQYIALDSTTNPSRALVTDVFGMNGPQLLAVDLSTGVREILSDNTAMRDPAGMPTRLCS